MNKLDFYFFYSALYLRFIINNVNFSSLNCYIYTWSFLIIHVCLLLSLTRTLFRKIEKRKQHSPFLLLRMENTCCACDCKLKRLQLIRNTFTHAHRCLSSLKQNINPIPLENREKLGCIMPIFVSIQDKNT